MRSKLEKITLIVIGSFLGILISFNLPVFADKTKSPNLPIEDLRTFAEVLVPQVLAVFLDPAPRLVVAAPDDLAHEPDRLLAVRAELAFRRRRRHGPMLRGQARPERRERLHVDAAADASVPLPRVLAHRFIRRHLLTAGRP